MTKINTILQCFVDLNLETDENTQFFLDLPKISFEKPSYSFSEGEQVIVSVSLDSPSQSGIEEVEIDLVINNTSAADFGVLGLSYPQTLIFSAGEQTKELGFLAYNDFVENEIESFDLILGFFTNTTPGQYITTTVNIVDETKLRSVSIKEQGGVISSNNSIIEFSAFEGASKNVIIALDSPSIYGVESVDVEFTNITANSGDYVVTGNISLSWAPGEQNKTITLQTNSDEEIEDTESLSIKLINPINVNIQEFSQAKFNILDSSPKARYATANFQGFYIQKGDTIPNVEARFIKRNTIVSYKDATWRMFIKFGDYIEQNWQTFNPPSTSSISPPCANGCVNGYTQGQQSMFQNNSKIFFGKNPATNTYGDLRLKIKNIGSHPCKINNSTISVGQSITLNVNSFDFKVKLPANDILLSAGTFYEGTALLEDTLTECNYDFTFEVDYDGLNFKLRNSDNSISSNKQFNLGAHRFQKTFNSSNADLANNYYNLTTTLSNVWPYWESNYTWPETAPYCKLPGTFATPDPTYPTNTSDLKNILVDGIMFLHQSVSNQNNSSTTKSMYTGFSFLPSGQTASSSGCTSVTIQNSIGVFAPQLQTSSIPFLVL